MSEGGNIAIALGVLFLIGGLMPLVVGQFYDVNDYNYVPTGISGSLYSWFDDGISVTILTQTYYIVGVDTSVFIQEQIIGFNIVTDEFPVLAKSILILLFVLMLYAVIKALPTT